MANRARILFILPVLMSGTALWIAAQQDNVIRREVELVQLNVAVTDSKGSYVTGLRASDFAVSEDNIQEKVATFEEGNAAPLLATEVAREEDKTSETAPAQEPPQEGAGRAAVRHLVRGECLYSLRHQQLYVPGPGICFCAGFDDGIRSLPGWAQPRGLLLV